MPEPRSLMTGLVFGEQPRWHEDRLWFSDWGTQEVIAVDVECLACALGGADRRTLFMMATEWNGPAGQVLTAEAPAPGAGWP